MWMPLPNDSKNTFHSISLPEQTSAVIEIDAEIDFRDISSKFFNDLKSLILSVPDNTKPIFCTHHVYDYGTSKVVGRDQEHIKLELVDNKSNNVMNGIAFGQSSHVRYIKNETFVRHLLHH